MNRSEKIEELIKKDRFDFDDLTEIMGLLRSEGGCPWDREQTHKSIRKDFIEETYEAIEAIDNDDPHLLREELGDVLLQIVFHARIAEEENQFDIGDVITELCTKLIHRHPHVFGSACAENGEQVLERWNQIKNEEKQRTTVTSRLRSVPPSLPALMKASKVGKRAACFDFPDALSAFEKIREEMNEVSELVGTDDADRLCEEIGDLLFSVANFARKSGIDAEEALNMATEKFVNRFERMEETAAKEGKCVESMSENELNYIWEQQKEKI